MKNIKKEENSDYIIKIFNKKSIDQIIKSKNDLELDKLKYDYSNKIGSIEAKTISGHTKHIRSKNKFEIKHKKYNSINNKIKTALFNNEIGKLETQKYNIEDFIELKIFKKLGYYLLKYLLEQFLKKIYFIFFHILLLKNLSFFFFNQNLL